MSYPLEPTNFNFNTEEGVTSFYMTAQAELYSCLNELEQSVTEITTIIHSIDLQLSSNENLKNVDSILHKYILSWQTLHLYYQELLKIKNIQFPQYYQTELYSS